MRLREIRRLPGRYREDEVPELPPNPTAVQPTVAFDATLRPAAFPTLDPDQFPPDNNPKTPSKDTDTSESEESEEPVTLFRDPRSAEEFNMGDNITDPGEFVPHMFEAPVARPTVPLQVNFTPYRMECG